MKEFKQTMYSWEDHPQHLELEAKAMELVKVQSEYVKLKEKIRKEIWGE